MDVAMYKIDNAYYIPNFSVTPRICKTNLASNTAFRGYGGPQVVWIMENVFHDVALTLNKPINEVSQHFRFRENHHSGNYLGACIRLKRTISMIFAYTYEHRFRLEI